LTLLLTTHLRDSEILLGKLLARLTHLAGLLLTGLPVLALTLLWGGIDAGWLAAEFANAGLTLLSVGGLALFCSARLGSERAAAALAYVGLGPVLLVLGGLSLGAGRPVSMLEWVVQSLEPPHGGVLAPREALLLTAVWCLVAVHLVLGLLFLS